MVSHAKRLRKKRSSAQAREIKSAEKRARKRQERMVLECRHKRVAEFRSFGKKAAAALFVCGALAIIIRPGAGNFGSKNAERDETHAVEDSGKENWEKGGEPSGVAGMGSPANNGYSEIILTNNDYLGWAPRINPWAGTILSFGGTADARVFPSGTEKAGEARGIGDGGKPGKSIKKEEPGRRGNTPQWRWVRLDALPASRMRKFRMDPLVPED
jgi:hypothetical protein